MRRSIDEVKTELQIRSAEFEKRRRSRVKSLAIGAGAALVLMLAAVPVISGALSAKNGSPMPMTAAYSGSNNSAEQPTDDAAQNGMDNFKPPRDDDGASVDGMPANSESTAFPGAPANSEPTTFPGEPSNGGSGGDGVIAADGYYYPESGMFYWYDETGVWDSAWRSFPRNEIEPQWAMIVVSENGETKTHEIGSGVDAKALFSFFLELHDSAKFFEVIDTIDPEHPRAIEYKVRLFKDGLQFDIIRFMDGSFGFTPGILLKPDAASAEAFDALVAGLCENYSNP